MKNLDKSTHSKPQLHPDWLESGIIGGRNYFYDAENKCYKTKSGEILFTSSGHIVMNLFKSEDYYIAHIDDTRSKRPYVFYSDASNYRFFNPGRLAHSKLFHYIKERVFLLLKGENAAK